MTSPRRKARSPVRITLNLTLLLTFLVAAIGLLLFIAGHATNRDDISDLAPLFFVAANSAYCAYMFSRLEERWSRRELAAYEAGREAGSMKVVPSPRDRTSSLR